MSKCTLDFSASPQVQKTSRRNARAKPAFEIYAALLAGEIGDHKFSLADLGEDAEINVLVRWDVLQDTGL